MSRTVLWLLPTVFSVYLPMCAPAVVSPTLPPSDITMAELWEPPRDLPTAIVSTARGALTRTRPRPSIRSSR